MSKHCLIPGWFTPDQWQELAPYVARLAGLPSGVLIIAVEVAPHVRNYPTVSFGLFDAEERKALKAALERARKKRTPLPAPGKHAQFPIAKTGG